VAPPGAVIALRDRTVRNSLREIVSQREQLASYGHIAAGIAHEVKNPLGGIRGAAELIISRTKEASTREIAEIVVREVGRIASLVDDLMVFTQEDSVNFQAINIHRVLDEVLDLITLDSISEGITIERRYDPSIPELMGDGNRLAQVFLNLMRNAVQAMEHQGGRLTITTRMPLDHRLSSLDGVPIPTSMVSISDTGPGIPADLIHKLATPFFTTRPDGTGLGLAVSRNWVSLHGGTMRIESVEGEGTTVNVALPLRRTDS
jgi:two-component system nitrogen regulation sensor histidine kinase GlnL